MMPKYFEFVCPVKICSGRKAIANLPYELSQLGAKRCMLISDQGVKKAGLLETVRAAFADSDLTIAAEFDEVPVDSSNRVVNAVSKIYKQKKCDSLVAVGGGSVLDTAKGVNIVISEKTDDLLKLQGVDRLTGPMQPFIAVPTTAGTGSEVTCVAVIYNEDAGVKMAFTSNKLYPDTTILDPVMTMTMPPKITAASGMDALTHAVEAYFCLQKNPVSDAFAVAAIRLIMAHIKDAVSDGKNEEARMAMANAALLAGIAFSNSMVGMVHALAHACGGVAHVPHGVANSILLPFGINYNIDKATDNIAELAPVLGKTGPFGSNVAQAGATVEAIKELAAQLHDICGLPLTLSEAGVREEQLEEIAEVAINDGALTYNPDEMNREQALAILKKAF